MPIFQATTDNELTCVYYLNSKGRPGMLGVCQEKPSGLIKLDYKGNNRWGNFQYCPWNNKGDQEKKNFHDIYIDIDFDGYLDVRYVIDNISEKIIKRYIMVNMDWEEMKNVIANQDVQGAISIDEAKYIFMEGSWGKGNDENITIEGREK